MFWPIILIPYWSYAEPILGIILWNKLKLKYRLLERLQTKKKTNEKGKLRNGKVCDKLKGSAHCEV